MPLSCSRSVLTANQALYMFLLPCQPSVVGVTPQKKKNGHMVDSPWESTPVYISTSHFCSCHLDLDPWYSQWKRTWNQFGSCWIGLCARSCSEHEQVINSTVGWHIYFLLEWDSNLENLNPARLVLAPFRQFATKEITTPSPKMQCLDSRYHLWRRTTKRHYLLIE